MTMLSLTAVGWATDTAWVRLYDGVTSECRNGAADIAVGPDGNVYVVGVGEVDWVCNADMTIAAYTSDGRFLDIRSVGGWHNTERTDDVAHALAFDRSGGIYAVGFTNNFPETRGDDITWARFFLDQETLALSWVGKTFWPGKDWAFDVVVGRNDDIYLCGADHRDTMFPVKCFTESETEVASDLGRVMIV
jgi:hypothetical protein